MLNIVDGAVPFHLEFSTPAVEAVVQFVQTVFEDLEPAIQPGVGRTGLLQGEQVCELALTLSIRV